MKRVKAKGTEVVVFEPSLTEPELYRSKVIDNLAQFKQTSDVIVANRNTPALTNVIGKACSRDLFGKDQAVSYWHSYLN